MKLQKPSFETWERKYALKDHNGELLEKTPEENFERVARALAEVEEPDKREVWYEKFLWAMKNGALPAGRIMSNAGAADYKPATSTINCTVSGTIPDSMDGILTKLHEAGMTLKTGAGIGYDFSTLRPKGSFVKGPGANTSGPLSFMDIYDRMCFTVSSAGGRRGAQMGALDIRHPDIREFINAKRKDGALRQFNLSVLITDKFVEAVKNGDEWKLIFPVKRAHFPEVPTGEDFVWEEWPEYEDAIKDRDTGLTLCKVYETISARDLWDEIMHLTYNYAEPGFILIDRSNEMNNNWWCEEIRTTNPCGEQNLPPYGSCLLGSVDLTKFVSDSHFNWDLYREVVRVFTRMLDNVVEINGLPLEQQREEIFRKRRHGMGFLGLGSAMTMLGIRYGDNKPAIQFTEQIIREMVLIGWEEGVELAKEKGPAPIMEEEFYITGEILRKCPALKNEGGHEIGDRVSGKTLFCYSNYVQRALPDELLLNIQTYGCRFTHHTSIAPTGTIAFSFGNNASNGIEPTFSHQYKRNIIVEGNASKKQEDVFSAEMLDLIEREGEGCEIPDYMVATDDLSPMDHLAIQSVAQRWVDSSISKTINVPTDIPFEEFKDIYMKAYELGLKGCTTFRFNPEVFSGVLVRDEDLKSTQYKFTLDNGEVVIVPGNEKIMYEGQEHVAANLFDAIKEGYYGKF